MTCGRLPHFLDPLAIFDTLIALLRFHAENCRSARRDMKSCPEAACRVLCDVFATCVGLVQTREGPDQPPGRNYLGGMHDTIV